MFYLILLAVIVFIVYKYFTTKAIKGFDNETYRQNHNDWRSKYKDQVTFKKEFLLGIVGESFENRQQIIRNCKAGDRCYLVHETENKYDRNAVAVIHQSGNKIGYISKHTNERFVFDLNNGTMIDSVIESINGEFPKFGVVLNIKLWE